MENEEFLTLISESANQINHASNHINHSGDIIHYRYSSTLSK
jgi:hypothetical protein